MKLGLISSFYKKSEPFHKECLESIAIQSDYDFTAILFGDNFNIDISKYNFKCHIEYEYLTKLSPREIKTKGIKKAIRLGCDYICFIDSDDFMKKNRIRHLKKFVKMFNFDILIHDFDTIKSNSQLIKKNALVCRSGYYEKEFFYKKNISGFGNTLFKTKLFEKLLPFPSYTNSLDWECIGVLSFFSRIYYINKSLTNYRQHNNNANGLNKLWNLKRLNSEINTINKHYRYLNSFFSNNKDIEDLLSTWKEKIKMIKKDKTNYIKELNKCKNLKWQELI